MDSYFTKKELELKLGKDVKELRLLQNISRETLCDHADISLNALRHLEDGTGASIKTLISVAIVLNKVDWLSSIAPQISINPLRMVKGKVRKRASQIPIKTRSSLSHKKESLKVYGLTIDKYVNMHEFQKGKCGNPGCTVSLDLNSRITCVDHNHETGKVRSLLCSGCNTALGFLKENKERANGLAEYIKKHNQ